MTTKTNKKTYKKITRLLLIAMMIGIGLGYVFASKNTAAEIICNVLIISMATTIILYLVMPVLKRLFIRRKEYIYWILFEFSDDGNHYQKKDAFFSVKEKTETSQHIGGIRHKLKLELNTRHVVILDWKRVK